METKYIILGVVLVALVAFGAVIFLEMKKRKEEQKRKQMLKNSKKNIVPAKKRAGNVKTAQLDALHAKLEAIKVGKGTATVDGQRKEVATQYPPATDLEELRALAAKTAVKPQSSQTNQKTIEDLEREALQQALAKVEKKTTSYQPPAEVQEFEEFFPSVAKETGEIHVLVVDDSPTVRAKVSKLLEREGFKVHLAVDGLDGLNKLEAIRPDVIVTDVEMPNLDGFGFVRQVRSNPKTSGIQIIVMTSHVSLHLGVAAIEGINGFLPKPFEEAELIEQINFLAANHQN